MGRGRGKAQGGARVRLLFQDYAPIPAQKALLARRTGDARWFLARPGAAGDERRDALRQASTLRHAFWAALGPELLGDGAFAQRMAE